MSAVLCGTLAGCLQRPSAGGNQDASPQDAAVADATPVDATPVDASSLPTGEPFPDSSTYTEITGAAHADLNDDGIEDLVLANDVDSLGTRGLYVLLGSRDRELTQYHLLIKTLLYRPRSVLIADLNEDQRPDIACLAVHQDGKTAVLLVYLGLPSFGFSEALVRELPRELIGPQGCSCVIVAGRFGGNTHLDVAVGYSSHAAVILLDQWEEAFPTNPVSLISFAGEPPGELYALDATPSANAGGDDLIAAHRMGNTLVPNGGEARFDGDQRGISSDLVAQRMAVTQDLDGDGDRDIFAVGFAGGERHGVAIVQDDSVSSYHGPVAELLSHELIAVVQADSDPRSDLLVATAAPSTLQLQLNLTLDATTVPGTLEFDDIRDAVPLEADDPELIQIGDFDDDGVQEVYLIQQTGRSECFELHPTGVIPCPAS